tara:strand:- start:362 stop:658 length:297 start_codon:yes stop_codon:yes gene_type:complete
VSIATALESAPEAESAKARIAEFGNPWACAAASAAATADNIASASVGDVSVEALDLPSRGATAAAVAAAAFPPAFEPFRSAFAVRLRQSWHNLSNNDI